jgi:cobalt-zinc-cadmium resistance protein CzcA
VDANLMSLGAIDFGIIIDGSVIIVEFISLQILRKWDKLKTLPRNERQKELDHITFKSTNKMMHSAVFGQLIILIVFIPVLTLTGVEGKMFRPMALTFSFALLGAMLFGFTYVPVAASLFLKPAKNPRNFSFRLIEWLKGLYIPSIRFALKNKVLVLSVSAVLLIISVITFSRMGGEFVPTLDEGDFVIQPILKTGTSLSKTIETTTRIEKILLKQFPSEVDQVVSRIGAAEVPTDPMSMEEADIIIKLKDKKYWKNARTKDELANKFKKALEVIPGVGYEFTQPIEMRFNELITGVRADIAVKIYGEDLAILNRKAKEASNLIDGIPGAADISVEKVEGLPQISIKYDRQKLAKFDVNVKQLNKIVSLAFAGVKAGVIFSGEKNFDLVVRYQNNFKKNIENVKDLRVKLPSGNSIPFTELADISYTEGPAKISRDNTKRRIVVGINVRDRDLESVVKDIQQKLETNLHLPAGYYVEYGGQFENLRTAKKRLTIAIPVALLLIFILLHFAFQSIKEAIMVYTAIPLSAVGGVFLLWLRDMPFSISAGVGFIALFGIAVLNGIVLIEHYKSLKAQGMTDVNERIIKGSSERLRPVLLTAAAAALGFFPMAFSHNVGAEVQRPLATVVIGGLFTATLLTMIVLPVLYSIFDKPLKTKKKMKKSKKILTLFFTLLGIVLLGPATGYSQTGGLKLSAAIDSALIHNQDYQSRISLTKESKTMISTAVDFGKTEIYYSVDENNQAEQGLPLHIMGIQQSFAYPGVYSAKKKALRKNYEAREASLNISKNRLIKNVSLAYYQIVYLQNKLAAYKYLDSLYTRFSDAAGKKLKAGEANYLEKLTAESKKQEIHTRRLQMEKELEMAYQELYKYMGTSQAGRIVAAKLEPLPYHEPVLANNPYLVKAQKEKEASMYMHKTEKRKLVPDLKLEYFTGKTTVANARWYSGFTVGLAIPLWFGPQKSRAKASGFMLQAAQQKEKYRYQELNTKKEQLMQKLEKYLDAIRYYQNKGKTLSRTLFRTADKSFMAGEINYFQFIQSMKAATDIRLNYLDNLQQYNQTVLELQYIEL